MPSLFKTNSIAELASRREQVEREIASSTAFLAKIDRRIAYLKANPKPAVAFSPTGPNTTCM